ncbi:hypothetical protein [Gramella sp. AN32]|uniref:LVIVD repeat-containing protein n=1 Tax=Christiangramia antarctica TaxID=2058158 RepID=A0ABW5X971_9FLAO|nr:hypothetical protein [Gramella sp. AN32]MCM4155569.1 hypothetical protein [Gramella sp. AN32]
MKKLALLASLFLFVFTSCENEIDDSEYTSVAVPVKQSLQEFRASVKIQEPKDIQESGKIYAWNNYIFINDVQKGVHIIDNIDPFNPKNVQFINIPRNMDVAVKDNKLYADSGTDLVIFDLQDMNNIKEIGRVENVFPNVFPQTQLNATFIDYENFDPEKEVIIGFVIEKRKIEYATQPNWEDAFFANSAESSTGTGGSFARFSIKDDYLYVADDQKLSVFDIRNPAQTTLLNQDYAGFAIETLFNYEDHLYLGSDRGLYIFSIEDAAKPKEVSYLQHVLGCDPVVVEGDYAYVTIRGGNFCGQENNQLDVVNITDKHSPFIEQSYQMTNPYGLGIKGDWLFVCDGADGLKVFDKSNTPNLELIDHFKEINTYDVIPLEERLLMVGDNTLYQYSYKGNEVNLISTFTIN